jgi:hypothetical protein
MSSSTRALEHLLMELVELRHMYGLESQRWSAYVQAELQVSR